MQHLFILNEDEILTSFWSAVMARAATVWNTWQRLKNTTLDLVNGMGNSSYNFLCGSNNINKSWPSHRPGWNLIHPILEPIEMNLIAISAYSVCLGWGMDNRQGGHRVNDYQHHITKRMASDSMGYPPTMATKTNGWKLWWYPPIFWCWWCGWMA